MQRQYSFPVAAVGTSQEVSQDWQIASVSIDNPSGLWLYLGIVARWVPPQTLGWVVNISPTVSRLTIDYVAAPSGGTPSVVSGGPIIVTVFDEANADVTGLDYALIPAITSLDAAILALRDAIDALNSGTGTAVQANQGSVYAEGLTVSGSPLLQANIIAGIPGERIYLRRVTVQMTISINGHAYRFFHIPFTLELFTSVFGTTIWVQNNDGSSALDIEFEPNTVFSAVGDGIDILIDPTQDANSGIRARYNVLLEYYHQ